MNNKEVGFILVIVVLAACVAGYFSMVYQPSLSGSPAGKAFFYYNTSVEGNFTGVETNVSFYGKDGRAYDVFLVVANLTGCVDSDGGIDSTVPGYATIARPDITDVAVTHPADNCWGFGLAEVACGKDVVFTGANGQANIGNRTALMTSLGYTEAESEAEFQKVGMILNIKHAATIFDTGIALSRDQQARAAAKRALLYQGDCVRSFVSDGVRSAKVVWAAGTQCTNNGGTWCVSNVSGNFAVTCSNGKFVSSVKCSSDCVESFPVYSGQCGFFCVNGKKCVDGVSYSCSPNGTLSNPIQCPNGCYNERDTTPDGLIPVPGICRCYDSECPSGCDNSSGLCLGAAAPACVDGTFSCVGGFSYECLSGVLGDGVNCSNGCDNLTGQCVAAQADTSLKLYLNFNDGTANDQSGNGNNGVVNISNYNSTGGVRDSGAFMFNGKSNIKVNSSSSLLLDAEGTISVWVKPSVIVSRTLIEKLGSLRTAGNAQENYWLAYGSSGMLNLILGNGTNQTYTIFNDSSNINKWHHVVGVWNSSHLSIYVDGVLKNSSIRTINTLNFNTTSPLVIGGDMRAGWNFSGVIDEVRIYNKALSVDQIQALYVPYCPIACSDNAQCGLENVCVNGGTCGSYCSGLRLYVPFNDGSANDSSVDNTDGVVYGTPVYNSTGGIGGSGAFMFDGSNDFINFSNKFLSKDFSVGVWVYWVNNSAGVIFDNGYKPTSKAGWEIRHGSADPSVVALCAGNTTNDTCYAGSSSLEFNKWHHFMFTYDSSLNVVKLYVHGALNNSASLANINLNIVSNPNIGKYTSGGYFKGTIDEVRVYNKVLSDSEVQAVYSLTVPITCNSSVDCGNNNLCLNAGTIDSLCSRCIDNSNCAGGFCLNGSLLNSCCAECRNNSECLVNKFCDNAGSCDARCLPVGSRIKLTTTGYGTSPDIYGSLVVWADNRSGINEVYTYNIASKQESQVTTGGGIKPLIFEDKLLYEKNIGATRYALLHDLSEGTDTNLTPLSFDGEVYFTDFSGNKISYTKFQDKIWVQNLNIPGDPPRFAFPFRNVTMSSQDGSIDGNGTYMVYTAFDYYTSQNLYFCKLNDTGCNYEMKATYGYPVGYAGGASSIYEDKIVWTPEGNAGDKKVHYCINNGSACSPGYGAILSSPGTGSEDHSPVIWNNTVVWARYSSALGGYDLYTCRISGLVCIGERALTSSHAVMAYSTKTAPPKLKPFSIYGHYVVYSEVINGTSDIYLYDLNG